MASSSLADSLLKDCLFKVTLKKVSSAISYFAFLPPSTSSQTPRLAFCATGYLFRHRSSPAIPAPFQVYLPLPRC
jgi:hypothetical protein